ncbi:MAG: Fur family transcriptional regulator, partial [Promethearchaeota archaeon]
MKQNEESDIDKNEYCINFLKSKKIKVTPQRIAICHYLLFTQEHPTAEDILNNAVKLCPTVSIATVYKTLKVFKEKKIVRELELNGITRY